MVVTGPVTPKGRPQHMARAAFQSRQTTESGAGTGSVSSHS